ncbi:MAG TPA: DUF4293 domain-containing protein [Prolixibacteraceae bacterium]|nr:DUF4293 domain-containing protein [Prolixibacteraceae bacterium]
MIQRIQTLYLFIAGLLVAMLFFLPLAEMVDKQGILYQLNVAGVTRDGAGDGGEVISALPLISLVCLVVVITMLTIFQFKNRVRQIRLSYLALFLMMALTAVISLYIWQYKNTLGGEYSLKVFASFPLVSAVLVYLAIRGIVKDENLVKSIDRIR